MNANSNADVESTYSNTATKMNHMRNNNNNNNNVNVMTNNKHNLNGIYPNQGVEVFGNHNHNHIQVHGHGHGAIRTGSMGSQSDLSNTFGNGMGQSHQLMQAMQAHVVPSGTASVQHTPDLHAVAPSMDASVNNIDISNQMTMPYKNESNTVNSSVQDDGLVDLTLNDRDSNMV